MKFATLYPHEVSQVPEHLWDIAHDYNRAVRDLFTAEVYAEYDSTKALVDESQRLRSELIKHEFGVAK